LTAAELVHRLPGSRPAGSGWRAPCPAHGSKGATLAVRDGRSGRALVYCFAGCKPDAVLQAVGLGLRDLMPPSDRDSWPRSAPRAASHDDVRAALRSATQEYRADHRIDSELRLTGADANAIRRTVSARLGVNLPPAARTVADSWAAGRERDPMWPMLLERAWREAWILADGREPCCPIELFASHGQHGYDLLERAEALAALELQGFAGIREASSAR